MGSLRKADSFCLRNSWRISQRSPNLEHSLENSYAFLSTFAILMAKSMAFRISVPDISESVKSDDLEDKRERSVR